MRPISPHDCFFSSLNRVEKRLASEKESISFATPPSPISFGSPLYLSSPKPQPASFKPSALDESSGPAPEFLSIPPMVYDPAPPLAAQKEEFKYEEEDDEIDRLISLLGLSADGEEGGGGLGSCHCSGGEFYRRVVGVKGPICEKEMGRLDGWIEHYRRERREPARLAHLLLAKAVSMEASRGGDDGDDDDDAFGAIGFPPTVEEFLEHDPPTSEGNCKWRVASVYMEAETQAKEGNFGRFLNVTLWRTYGGWRRL
ncbi:uncharacterized protein LOC110110768 isoform X2 [Dendrobium catenatum]|uniref:uncharacterized protein LOC110110768 isoform X2 n=1 Tax=Dendrobium catenatum TaxID=906689 RepID=UPI0009F51AAC|nr:uncharacterized protein LOC110110768 isoform X2 [Dendrobium catenatum]